MLVLKLLGKIQNESFRLFPAKAWIGDRFAEDMIAGSLRAVLKVAFDHQTLDKALDRFVLIPAVNNILGDSDLFKILFSRVVVVCIHDNRRIGKSRFCVQLADSEQILVMIIGNALARIIQVSAKDRVGLGVALAYYLPAAVNKGMA